MAYSQTKNPELLENFFRVYEYTFSHVSEPRRRSSRNNKTLLFLILQAMSDLKDSITIFRTKVDFYILGISRWYDPLNFFFFPL